MSALTRCIPLTGDNLTNTASYLKKQCETGCTLVLLTNMKSHTGFRLVSKLVNLNDPERLNNWPHSLSQQ